MYRDTINAVFGGKPPRHVYFIGIGGVSMSSLAAMTLKMGITVSGYDRAESPAVGRLRSMGIRVFCEYSPENIASAISEANGHGDNGGNDSGYTPVAVVYTAAIAPGDPELVRARELGLTCYTRAEYLGRLMLGYRRRIGVSGTHGKSTVTSMLTHIFLEAGLDPTAAVGAELAAIGGAYRTGGGDSFIFEACEYTDSFLSFFPTTSVVLNIEMDHVDYFKSMEQLLGSFCRYIALADTAVLNLDDANVRLAAEGFAGRLAGYSASGGDADYTARDISYERGFAGFDILRRGELLGRAKLRVPGSHNVGNALAAAAAAFENGVPPDAIIRGLEAFPGAKRRFERKGSAHGAEVYDDYAHHPTEIKATLEGAARLGFGRIICVYQPHTFSRTAGFMEAFEHAFGAADTVVFADIYAAREKNTSGVTSAKLAAETPGALYLPSFEEIARYVRSIAKPGDLVLTMGAGDVWRVADMLAAGD